MSMSVLALKILGHQKNEKHLQSHGRKSCGHKKTQIISIAHLRSFSCVTCDSRTSEIPSTRVPSLSLSFLSSSHLVTRHRHATQQKNNLGESSARIACLMTSRITNHHGKLAVLSCWVCCGLACPQMCLLSMHSSLCASSGHRGHLKVSLGKSPSIGHTHTHTQR